MVIDYREAEQKEQPENGITLYKHLMYPNYTNWYEYTVGTVYIDVKVTRSCYGGPSIRNHTIEFDSVREAWQYFQENCGAQ